ncbi:hypothetical protein CK203_058911 [Vitis vinifera]|uniref:Retrotransposon gag domain-containing protein n=1 Tax=Vitis vinifera TaxID=29760 RepID=A0A438FS48_VITVI|nr:hypothetical protein CK203_058911 [Vitis vinifera]
MNFLSYVAEFSREWDEPNARDKGRMTSQPKAKGEMYILNDGMNMKAEIATMERRLEELEMNQMQPVQAISQTPLQAMPCAICLSYEHLVDECPYHSSEREMFRDCNTYNSNWRDHPNFSWKPQPPQYQQPAQAPQQASILEQAMVNLCKVVGDFVGKQEAINAQINQRIDSMESTLNKRMDEMQNDMAQKLDILQDSISRLANLNTVQEKENSPSQPYQNSMSFWMIKIKRNCKEIEEKKSEQNRSKIGVKRSENRGETGEKQGSARFRSLCEIEILLRKPVRNPIALSAKIFAAAKPILAHECHFAAQEPPFRSCESGCEPPKHEILHFAGKAPFERVFGSCETHFCTRVPLRSTGTPISQLRNGCEVPSMKDPISQGKLHLAEDLAAAKHNFGT